MLRAISVLVAVGALGGCTEGVISEGRPDGTICEGGQGVGPDGECRECDGDTVPIDGVCACPAGTVDIGGSCVTPERSEGLGTDWHPDPDGDGIATPDDTCPYIYDPAQTGDECDPDGPSPTEGGGIIDLHAEHVTPFGAWLSFRSADTVEFQYPAVIAYSTNRADLESTASIAAMDDADLTESRSTRAPLGVQISSPVILMDLEPNTTYFITARRRYFDGIDDAAGNIIEITTAPDPLPTVPAEHPRAFATPAMLAELAQRAASDARFGIAEDTLGPPILGAAGGTINEFEHDYCVGAALLFHATGNAQYGDAATTLLASILNRWENEDLGGPEFTRADVLLGICTDLMWNELSVAERERHVNAFLDVDEEHIDGDVRLDDTDETVAQARSAIIDGLVACGSTDIDPALQARGCELLDWGKRLLYGFLLVKARRDRGFWAQSGGHLPDGAFYFHGSSGNWIETMYAAENAGGGIQEYAPWILNNLFALHLYPITPRRKGYFSFGDVESYSNDDEANSMPFRVSHGGGIAHRMGILAMAGWMPEAELARGLISDRYSEETKGRMWPLIAFDNDAIGERTMDAEPVTYFDSGMGILYDRTSWSPDASFFVFQAGWNGVDHSHGDNGHFQLYRRGNWITHENLSYSGEPADSPGHNVMLLTTDESDSEQLGQYNRDTVGLDRTIRISSAASHAFAAADITASYQSHTYRSYRYEMVQRQIVWLKTDEGASSDRVIVFDLVDDTPGTGPHTRQFQLHLDGQPTTAAGFAEFITGEGADASRIAVDAVLPTTTTFSVRQPTGEPNNFPGEMYTHRLIGDPGTNDPNLRMVTVIRASDAAQSTPAPPTAIDEPALVGAVVGSDVVVFERAPLDAVATAAAARELTISAAGPITVWWTGLAAGVDYDVQAVVGDGTVTLSVTPGQGALKPDSGGMLAFTVAATGDVSPVYADSE